MTTTETKTAKQYLQDNFDWSATKLEYRERVIDAIACQVDIIAACTGALERAQTITYCMQCATGLFQSSNNYRFDAGGWADDDEQVLAVRV